MYSVITINLESPKIEEHKYLLGGTASALVERALEKKYPCIDTLCAFL